MQTAWPVNGVQAGANPAQKLRAPLTDVRALRSTDLEALARPAWATSSMASNSRMPAITRQPRCNRPS